MNKFMYLFPILCCLAVQLTLPRTVSSEDLLPGVLIPDGNEPQTQPTTLSTNIFRKDDSQNEIGIKNDVLLLQNPNYLAEDGRAEALLPNNSYGNSNFANDALTGVKTDVNSVNHDDKNELDQSNGQSYTDLAAVSSKPDNSDGLNSDNYNTDRDDVNVMVSQKTDFTDADGAVGTLNREHQNSVTIDNEEVDLPKVTTELEAQKYDELSGKDVQVKHGNNYSMGQNIGAIQSEEASLVSSRLHFLELAVNGSNDVATNKETGNTTLMEIIQETQQPKLVPQSQQDHREHDIQLSQQLQQYQKQSLVDHLNHNIQYPQQPLQLVGNQQRQQNYLEQQYPWLSQVPAEFQEQIQAILNNQKKQAEKEQVFLENNKEPLESYLQNQYRPQQQQEQTETLQKLQNGYKQQQQQEQTETLQKLQNGYKQQQQQEPNNKPLLNGYKPVQQQEQAEEPFELPQLQNQYNPVKQPELNNKPFELPQLQNQYNLQHQQEQTKEPFELPQLQTGYKPVQQQERTEGSFELPQLQNGYKPVQQQEQAEEPFELPQLQNQYNPVKQPELNNKPFELPQLQNQYNLQHQQEQTKEPFELPQLQTGYKPVQQQEQAEEPFELPQLQNQYNPVQQQEQTEGSFEQPQLQNGYKPVQQQEQAEEPFELPQLQNQYNPVKQPELNNKPFELPQLQNGYKSVQQEVESEEAKVQPNQLSNDNPQENYDEDNTNDENDTDRDVTLNSHPMGQNGNIENSNTFNGESDVADFNKPKTNHASQQRSNWDSPYNDLENGDEKLYNEEALNEEEDYGKGSDREMEEEKDESFLNGKGIDDEDENYDTAQWKEKNEENETAGNEVGSQDNEEEARNPFVEDAVDEDLARKNRIPTAPTSMVLFYTWMIVAILIFVVGLSMYQTRCRGIRLSGTRHNHSGNDRKRLLSNECA